MFERKRLGGILVDLRVLSQADVDRVLEAMHRRRDRARFGAVAREMGLLREEHILAALAVQMEMFPDVATLSLTRLLQRLEAPADASSMRRPALQSGRRSRK